MTELPRLPYILVTSKGEATIVATDGQTVTLCAAFPAPPGCPLEGKLKETAHSLRVKVHGSRAIDQNPQKPQFEIKGRWVSLSRDARLLLTTEALAPARPNE